MTTRLCKISKFVWCLIGIFSFAIWITVFVYSYGKPMHVYHLLNLDRDESISESQDNVKSDENTLISELQRDDHDPILQELHQYIHSDEIDRHLSKKKHIIESKYLYPNQPFLKSNSQAGINPICTYLFPDYIYYFTSHKNGVYLMQTLSRTLRNYCNITYKKVWYTAELNGIMNSHAFRGEVQNVMAFHKTYPKLIADNRSLQIIFQMRSPIDTIWSAFNYHMKCPQADPWTKSTILTMKSFKKQPCCIIAGDQCARYHRNIIAWNDERWIDHLQHPLYDEYGNYLVTHTNETYCEWLQAVDNNFGFYVEFIRYINCEYGQNGWKYWKHVVSYSKYWKDAALNIFRMSQWINDFDGNTERFMDILNLIDNESNRQLLTDNGFMDFNLSDERMKLGDWIKGRADVHKWSSNKLNQSSHVNQVQASYQIDKNKTVHWILQHRNICLVLKNLTITLFFPWQYHQC